jgi:hypothetical protein
MAKKSDATPEDLLSGGSSRRGFMAQAGMATLGLFGASQLGAVEGLTGLAKAGGGGGTAQSDIDILNFALNLEYLEAEFYLRAVFGRGLDDSDTTGTGNRGNVTGGSAVPFVTPMLRDFATEIAMDEEAHVKFIRSVLGSAAIARPTIDLQQSFTNAAIAAGLISAGQTFNPFADEASFFLGGFLFEDVGVTAYKGAAPLLKSKTILSAAAGILAVEAYHAGEIRTVLYMLGKIREAKAISDLRDAVDGPTDDDQPIRVQGHANIVPSDANGLAFGRTTSQVLNIVYLGGASANFGFFPNKVNGNIK